VTLIVILINLNFVHARAYQESNVRAMNTNNLKLKTLNFVRTYKWLLIPVIPLFLFSYLLILAFSQPQPQSTQDKDILPIPTTYRQNQQTSIPTSSFQTSTPQNLAADLEEIESEENPQTLPGFQKLETNKNGTITYYYASENPSRPSIKIANESNQIFYSRTLTSQKLQLPTISLFKQTYGDPEQIVQGSRFYGQNTAIYIYGEMGMAFIGDTTTGYVFEQHLFSPMPPNEYMQRFGDL
jgi:hypothetical protein